MRLPDIDDLKDAAERIAGVAVRTPLIRHDALDAVAGGRVFVKAEVLQRTGSFKFRGAYNRISRLSAEERTRGVVAYSSGNHAQGVAVAAKLCGATALIVMPADAPALKIENTRSLGAEVVLYDRATESREAIAEAICKERGAVLVPPFEDPYIIAGQGTLGLEVIEDLRRLEASADALYCPTSGGGLMAGVALAFSSLSPATDLFAVEPEGFDDYGRSLKAGERLSNPRSSGSLLDALLTQQPGALTFEINRHRLAGARAVSDAAALRAVAFAFRHLKIVVEPGGAAALAAVLEAPGALQGKTAVVVASGGNVDVSVFTQALAT